MPTRLTLDEVVAGNIQRLRKQQDPEWSRSVLARKLGVELHVVRDMERPRKGQKQRSFSWTELVAICAAFTGRPEEGSSPRGFGAPGTNLFELVLPHDGMVLPSGEELDDAGDVVIEWESRPWAATGEGFEVKRNELGLILFGLPERYLSPEMLTKFAEEQHATYEKVLKKVEEMVVSEFFADDEMEENDE